MNEKQVKDLIKSQIKFFHNIKKQEKKLDEKIRKLGYEIITNSDKSISVQRL
jgi:hypothetical protein